MIDLTKLTDSDKERYYSKVDCHRHNTEHRSVWNICWGWRGSHKPKGYGRFYFQGHTVAAHRVAYFLMYGKLSPRLEIDHTCRARDCVNPWHLEAVCPELNRQRRIEHHSR